MADESAGDDGARNNDILARVPIPIRITRERPRLVTSGFTAPPPATVSVKRRKKCQADSSVFEFKEEDDNKEGNSGTHNAPPAVANVTVGDAGALECGICFHALRPPIFQCQVGHVVCSPCRDKLAATRNGSKCHVCRAATRGGYRRCHAMERLVDCIGVPCPYSAHGCRATPPYHDQESHRLACPHAPCRCPAAAGGGDDDSCGFVGSTAALLDHIAGAHDGWPCTRARNGDMLRLCLQVGFNFVRVDLPGDQATACRDPFLVFLLNVTRERLGRAISVLCIHPHAHTNRVGAGVDDDQHCQTPPLPSIICELAFSHFDDKNKCRKHYQSSEFEVACTDLSSGLPSTDDRGVDFIVLNSALGDQHKDYIEVRARINVN